MFILFFRIWFADFLKQVFLERGLKQKEDVTIQCSRSHGRSHLVSKSPYYN